MVLDICGNDNGARASTKCFIPLAILSPSGSLGFHTSEPVSVLPPLEYRSFNA